MKLTKRGEYALRAMIDIGIAHELGRPLIRIRELSEKENIPIKFLEAILLELKEAGYLGSKRGVTGGYSLAMPMNKIKIGDVVRKIEGPLAPIRCASVTAYEKCTCPDEEHCGLRLLMVDVRNAIANILDKYTLADTVEVALRKIRRDKAPLPFAVEID
jgi:Rrf2 family protein